MVQLPTLISLLFQYRSRIVPQRLGTGPERCGCGRPLGQYRAERTLCFLRLRLYTKSILVKHCPDCRRYFLPAGFVARWISTLAFLLITAFIWFGLVGIPMICIGQYPEGMLKLDLEGLKLFSLYALVAGPIFYFTGRAAWRRVVHAARHKVVEVDRSLGRSV